MDGWDLRRRLQRQRRPPRLRAVPRERTSPTTGPYARTFTLADHFFANDARPELPRATSRCSRRRPAGPPATPTSPHRTRTGAATRPGRRRVSVENQSTCAEDRVFPCFDIPTVPDVLPAGRHLEVLRHATTTLLSEVWSMFDAVERHSPRPGLDQRRQRRPQFDDDIASGHAAQRGVAGGPGPRLDEHPHVGSVCAGENWTVDRINQVMKSALLEGHRHPLHHGRLRRLVRPRAAAARSTAATPQHPYGLGFRLPLIVISPYAKPGFVFREVAEQA